MSITPILAAPPAAPESPKSPQGDAGGQAAGSFAALVAKLLGGPGQPEDPAASKGKGAQGSGDPTDGAEVAPDDEPARVSGLVGLGPSCVVQPLAPQAGARGTQAGGPNGIDPDADVARPPAPQDLPATSDVEPGPAPGVSAQTPANQAGTPDASGAAPAQAPGTTTAPSGPASTGEARPTASIPVTEQLVPELTRLVSRGDGTHRLTMTLQPESLGDVRVTLTVRNGEVQVRIAAGPDAQQALTEGAPELRRVLELTGATETRVVVRDLAPTTSHQSQPSPSTTLGGSGHGDATAAGDGREGTPDQHARTRGGSNARDGASDGASAPRPEPATHTRSTGVDVTM